MQQTTEVAPIHKSVTVARPVEEAFALFTDGIATWWPLATHSIFDQRAATAVFEGRVGGRLYELSADGEEGVWGTVLVWEPPHRIVYSWHPGRGEETAQEVEIRFTAEGERTRVDLEHRGWERAPEKRPGYDEGWDVVLGHYVEAAGARAIRKSIAVACPAQAAFRVFTEQIGSWWPLATKSVGLERSETLVLEPRAGGRFYERTADGEEVEWGEVLVWEPPQRLVFSWHPGRGPESAQEVEVRFLRERDGTRIELEHRGWERLGDRAEETLAHYVGGWDEVLERYAEAATR
jgi:uncharacterized protein YndB with AHSA1/START domain